MKAKNDHTDALGTTVRGPRPLLVFGLLAVCAATTGCTSPLTTVALREFLREATMAIKPAADEPDAEDKAVLAAESSKPIADEDPTSDAELADADSGQERAEEPLEVAIERSLERLSRARGLDPVARDLLVETLEKSHPDDWPAIIDSFAASLETSTAADDAASSVGTTSKTASLGRPSGEPKAKPAGGLTIPVTANLPAGAPAEALAGGIDETTAVVGPAAHEVRSAIHETDAGNAQDGKAPGTPGAGPEDHAAAQAASTAPEAAAADEEPSPEETLASLKQAIAEARRKAPLAVRRACFASKIRGWGNVDEFPEARFVPGQDVLVYVELDNLGGVETSKGCSTRVEARFRLVDGAQQVVEQWTFPAIEDTAAAARTDYFVRYLLRIPDQAAAGPHRLELVVSDTVATKNATVDLPLEISADSQPR